jgi:C-terminal processing protease CtpA/Prc
VQISGEDTTGYTPDDAAALLRGPESSRVSVVAQRGGAAGSSGAQRLDLVITRKKVCTHCSTTDAQLQAQPA